MCGKMFTETNLERSMWAKEVSRVSGKTTMMEKMEVKYSR
jgi:hypothetical protein